MSEANESPAAKIVTTLTARGAHLAVAESLTGGAICAEICAVPGASAMFRGGIVAYTVETKHSLAGVSPELIANAGVVSAEVAVALAEGAREACDADWGIGATGAAGPQPHDDQPPGTVWIATVGPDDSVTTRRHVLDGGRSQVQQIVVGLALTQLIAMLEVDEI